MFTRIIPLPARPSETFFLWGPRQSGKSTVLKKLYPQALWIDLLKTDEYLHYFKYPHALREELLSGDKKTDLVIIDEVQKVPLLLDEVHWLIENTGIIFGMCGSSARKVKRGQANLLGGRALRYEMHGLVSSELGGDFDLVRLLNHGYLPPHYVSKNPQAKLRSYVNDYLKEEIAEESLVRNLPVFSEFLNIAALSDTEKINMANIARECNISKPTVKEYFQILVDTNLGRFLPVYSKRPKRRISHAFKFYFSDVGVVNHLARRGHVEPGSELFGKAFENWVFHELLTYSHYKEKFADIYYWGISSGAEVDFVINNMECAIEVKSSAHVVGHHLKGLAEIKKDYPVKRRIVVSLEKKSRLTKEGIEIFSVDRFISELWNGKLF